MCALEMCRAQRHTPNAIWRRTQRAARRACAQGARALIQRAQAAFWVSTLVGSVSSIARVLTSTTTSLASCSSRTTPMPRSCPSYGPNERLGLEVVLTDHRRKRGRTSRFDARCPLLSSGRRLSCAGLERHGRSSDCRSCHRQSDASRGACARRRPSVSESLVVTRSVELLRASLMELEAPYPARGDVPQSTRVVPNSRVSQSSRTRVDTSRSRRVRVALERQTHVVARHGPPWARYAPIAPVSIGLDVRWPSPTSRSTQPPARRWCARDGWASMYAAKCRLFRSTSTRTWAQGLR